MLPDYEKLGQFYLGREYDLAAAAERPGYLLYDSKDLTTHAVCVGMTGSGKTGLCLALLEEAAIDGIPAIAIDPKGDLGNLLLTFPNLLPSDFRPWVEESEAARKGLSLDEYAAKTAEQWRAGLAQWDEDPARIERFRAAADVAIYTPGSTAGLPLTVLRSFAAPPAAVLTDGDALRERISAAAAGLLALLGVDADPIRSREQILLANILEQAWKQGRDLDLVELIRSIQTPPLERIGFVDLETFYPAKDRVELAMRLNNLLASPAFAGWLEGEPLNIQRLLYTPEGKPRLAILSIAHLSDAERMFFVTLLLNEILSWVRTQPGTSSLRALLYMDEVFGYFPPTANPPSKLPMLTLLKQARAYGLGVVLATQNPVDLDYKGLSNAGTWFLGRLQTERDKARVLEGLEGASAAAGATFDRQAMEATLAGLGQRVFLMNNVHEDHPVVFQTRWCLSYLRGPLTRTQISTLMAPRKAQATTETPQRAASSPPTSGTISSSQRPIVPPDAEERFVAARKPLRAGARWVYRPALIGQGRAHFVQSKAKLDHWQEFVQLVAASDELPDEVWRDAEPLPGLPAFDKAPADSASFGPLSAELASPKNYSRWRKQYAEHLYHQATLELWECAALKQISNPGESEGDFRIRLGLAAREARDAAVADLRKKYATKLAALENRLRTAGERVERERSQYKHQMLQTVMSFGSTLLGALMGRKFAASRSVTGASRTFQQHGDIGRAEESVEQLRRQQEELEKELADEVAALETRFEPEKLVLESLAIKPRKTDLDVQVVALAWLPFQVDSTGATDPMW